MNKTAQNNRYKHILKYTSLFGGVQGLTVLVGVVRNKLIALLLGPQGVGLLSLLNSVVKLLSDSTSFGLNMSGVQSVAQATDAPQSKILEERVHQLRVWTLLIAALGGLVTLVTVPWLHRWGGLRTLHLAECVLLAPVVAFTALCTGETALLKGTRQLSSLAKLSMLHVVGVLLFTLPLYYLWGMAAILPSLLIGVLLQLGLTLHFSLRLFPPRATTLRWQWVRSGWPTVRVGLAFVVAGMLGSGAEFLLRSQLSQAGGLAVVGLYNAAFMITMTYGGLVFSAMETDYFPRLSALPSEGKALRQTVNEQAEVSLLLLSPLLVAFVLVQPWLLPLLYSGQFLPAEPMVQAMILSMYLRALVLPVAYLPLARGHAWRYMVMEGLYALYLVSAVHVGFRHWGIVGVGWGVTAAALADLLTLRLAMGHWFAFQFSSTVLAYAAVVLPLGLASFAVAHLTSGWTWGVLSLLLLGGSSLFSLTMLHRHGLSVSHFLPFHRKP